MAGTDESVDVLVYDVTDLRRVLGVGRPEAYRLVKRLGRRLGKRLVVSRTVLETWLAMRPPRRRRRLRRHLGA